MATVEEFLAQLGLGATESAIYLEALTMPSITAQDLAKHTGIKRTTVYNALVTLTEKGYAAKVSDGGKRVAFKVIAPELIERKIQEQIELLNVRREQFKHILPKLERKHPKEKKNAVVVGQYEGLDGIKTVIDEALYCKSKKWDIIAPSNNFLSELDTSYADYFIRVRTARGIVARSLWEYDSNRRILTPDEIKMRNPRILPKVMHGKFSAMIILFDDTVALISSYREKSAVVVRSYDLSQTFKVLFEGLWASSEPYSDQLSKKS